MKRRTILMITLAVCLIDRAVKYLSLTYTAPCTLIPGILAWTPTRNTGMAFSLLEDAPWVGTLLSAVLIAAGVLIMRRYQPGWLNGTAAGLMFGGAVGNLIDRLFRGFVPDMFEPLFVRFAVFNAADAFLSVGCVLMAVSLLARPGEWSKRT